MRLPKIYDHFQQGQLFTIDEARAALNITGNTLRKRLCELSLRGYIKAVRQGLYQIAPTEGGTPLQNSSPYSLACKLTPWCYIGFKTALQFYAREHPPEGDTVFVVSHRKFNPFEHNGLNYFWCQSPDDWGLEKYSSVEGHWQAPIVVTDFEKTLLDCIKRPMHSPAMHEFIRLCKATGKRPDMEKLFRYAANPGTTAIFNRLGFLLDTMAQHWDISETTLKAAEERMSRRQTEWHIPASRGCAREFNDKEMSNRWHIQFPENPLDKPLADC
jgi:predicted transcriptional regulator of viral defense system